MRYPGPGAVRDPDTGDWISDAEVAEISYTAFASTDTPVTARLIVRRVKDARYRDALFPVWRYHPFFTDSTEPAPRRRRHPPSSRSHRNRVRRPDRRPARAHAFRALRRELGLGAVRGDHPQPAPRRGHPRRIRGAGCPRGHAAPQDRQHPRPAGPPTTTTPPAPSPPLALGSRMASDCGTTQSDNGPHRCRCQLDHPAARPDRIHRKAGQTSGFLVPKHRQPRSHVTSAVQPQAIGGSRLRVRHAPQSSSALSRAFSNRTQR